ncbi:hypothetical protein HanRHA438_Chr04g0173961 [Helianthus annuus]|uniref:Uncharacterized protein n=1 Tax=Helianthus annuus TaxID=4232 RepID=A0A251UYZ0_HELAN|nr:uncharacterized protein LOC110934775 [Helianthus annuus]KAF5810006.1 hypothetical protein HanXRQr2_Chr04g0164231 [Helianthus annuus]KAJ0580912.1 hypothetical protein HanHA300_Chr04g0134871 [Helianthus annuus]KAJ0596853.1 hypothetical protein HanHA89_Chr04g0147761 [Helianthus annuus]KAJ0629196.1 hypothetical protein HanIR_Chr00c22g0910291 [Helianthus annuus]KAJ0757532.1 hypothetical protein HanLR1_Chr04g0139851 [Helianthus annuus]
MTSTCMSRCIANDARMPVRATYVNLYKWPDSDREFVRSVSQNSHLENRNGQGHPRLVDSISCRQLYLRSYTFSRKESLNERTMKCIGRVKERANVRGKPGKSPASSDGGGRRRDGGKRRSRRKCTMVMKAREASYAALASIFRRLLSCTTKVDVVD